MTVIDASGILRGCAVAALILLASCGRESGAPQTPPQEVNVLAVGPRAVPLDLEYSARTRGVREVEVHARVSGILLKRYFRQGEVVPANALLFTIDPVPFQREVERLRGLHAVEQARLAEATAQRDRVMALLPKGFVSTHDRDIAVAAHASAEASAEAAQAALRQAQLNLSYTEVRAPIAGTSGVEWRSEGSLVKVGEESSLLTTLVQSDRLYVDFAIPEPEAALIRAAPADAVRVRLKAEGGAEIAQSAPLEFLDNRVNADSGTVWARALLDNREAGLAPGQFVLARVDGLSSTTGIYIPIRAVLRTTDGSMVWVVDAANKAAPRPVVPGQMLGNLVEVREGLQPGERVIVDGILKVVPGATVKAVELPLETLIANLRPKVTAESRH